jgi:hypothetical protein
VCELEPEHEIPRRAAKGFAGETGGGFRWFSTTPDAILVDVRMLIKTQTQTQTQTRVRQRGRPAIWCWYRPLTGAGLRHAWWTR